ncbi:hypothetical protein, partial [Rhodococcus opacus]
FFGAGIPAFSLLDQESPPRPGRFKHHGRVADLVSTHTTEAERAALRAQLTEGDQDLIDRMLDRRLDA